jgi:hypothetical protein
MSQKIVKGIRRRKVALRGTRAFALWHRKLVEGMRAAKLKRREAGLLTPREVAAELCLSLKSVRAIFPVIRAGNREFVRRSEIEKWKRATGAEDADAA